MERKEKMKHARERGIETERHRERKGRSGEYRKKIGKRKGDFKRTTKRVEKLRAKEKYA